MEQSFSFYGLILIKKSLFAECGSLPMVIAYYQPTDTQARELPQGSVAHKQCAG